MGVLHSIPLCSRGNGANQVEPLDLDKNNNEASVVYTSQPHAIVASVPVPPPEATSTPRPQSPTGLENEQYSDSSQWVLSSVLEFVNLAGFFIESQLTIWDYEFPLTQIFTYIVNM